MKKVLRIVGILAGVVVLGVAGLLTYVKTALPNVGPAPQLKIAGTKEQIARGKYLAHSVALCMDCHSTRDWNKFSGPLMDGTLGKGGETFDQKMGFPGSFYASNITHEGIGAYTDGELFRAITSGVAKDGRALFPVMPHPNYGKADKADIEAIIAYIRTIAPIKNEIPKSKADFPMNFIINTIPQKPQFVTKPDTNDILKHGEYLVNMASCADCHTQTDKGKKLPGMDFAGGFKFKLPAGTVQSSNITPAGIGSWTKEQFVARFKAYQDPKSLQTAGKDDFNSVMPWSMYASMSEHDLGAIFEYLKTVKPVENKVERWTKN